MAFTTLAPTGNRYNSDTARQMINDMYNRGGNKWLPQDALAAIGKAPQAAPGSAWQPPLPQTPQTPGFGPAISVAAPQTGGYDPAPTGAGAPMGQPQTMRMPMQMPISSGVQGGQLGRMPMQTPMQSFQPQTMRMPMQMPMYGNQMGGLLGNPSNGLGMYGGRSQYGGMSNMFGSPFGMFGNSFGRR